MSEASNSNILRTKEFIPVLSISRIPNNGAFVHSIKELAYLSFYTKYSDKKRNRDLIFF